MATEANAALATEENSKSRKKSGRAKAKETTHPMNLIFASTQHDEPTEIMADTMEFITAIRAGLPGRAIRVVAEMLQVSMGEVYSLLHISPRTAQRMIGSERLDVDKSDHLVQLIKIHKRCMDVFQDSEKAVRWLKTPNFSLGDQTPLSLLDTTDGIELVAKSLTKIEYGVFG